MEEEAAKQRLKRRQRGVSWPIFRAGMRKSMEIQWEIPWNSYEKYIETHKNTSYSMVPNGWFWYVFITHHGFEGFLGVEKEPCPGDVCSKLEYPPSVEQDYTRMLICILYDIGRIIGVKIRRKPLDWWQQINNDIDIYDIKLPPQWNKRNNAVPQV